MIDFFKGIKIVNGEKGINIIKNVAMEAYVELASKADIKAALKLDSKRVDDRVIHSKFCDAHLVFFPVGSFDAISIFGDFFLWSFKIVSTVEPKEIGNIASRISKTNESKVAQIRGLPWAVDKAYIIRLFPSKGFKRLHFCKFNLNIWFLHSYSTDIKVQKNHIQIEVDENNRRTGYAYVEFESIEDYNAALETDFKHINL